MVDVAEHLGLVYKIVGNMGHGQDDEFISAGMLGLTHAAKKFDAGRGFKFSTYAAYAIRHEVYKWRIERLRQRAGTSRMRTRQALVFIKYRDEFGVYPDLDLSRILLGKNIGVKVYRDLCAAASLINLNSTGVSDEGFDKRIDYLSQAGYQNN